MISVLKLFDQGLKSSQITGSIRISVKTASKFENRMTAVIILLPLEWPPFSLPCLVEPNSISHLQDFPMVLLQLEEDVTSGVAVFEISL